MSSSPAPPIDVQSIARMPIEKIVELVDETDDPDMLAAIRAVLNTEYPWRAQPHQLAPDDPFWTWVFQGGRGTGKTDTGANWLDEHMESDACDPRWPGGHKGLLLGPTHGDVIASCVKGVTGLQAHNRGIRLVNRKDGTFVVWPNGAEAVCLGMHTENDAERLRAQAANVCCWWIDEAAIGRHLTIALDNLAFGARGGRRAPQGIATTTPKPTTSYKKFLRMPRVTVTRASSYDNLYLTAEHRDLISHYEGTRLGRQEIHGELVDAYEGALWNQDVIDRDRIDDPKILALEPADLLDALGITRTAHGIDPSTWIPEVGVPDEIDDLYSGGAGVETGLVSVGIDRRNPPHVYVLADESGRLPAEKWAARAAYVHHRWGGPVVPETNAGGDLVLATIRLTDPNVPIFHDVDDATHKKAKKPGVRATTGKRARAEPVALLSDQHRFHIVGSFPLLESTLTGWDPTEDWSPDRMDALVWGVFALKPWKRRSRSGIGGGGSV